MRLKKTNILIFHHCMKNTNKIVSSTLEIHLFKGFFRVNLNRCEHDPGPVSELPVS